MTCGRSSASALSSGHGRRRSQRRERHAEGILLPRFTLDDFQGAAVSTRELRGKVVLVTFLESKCREACPIIAGVIGQALTRLTAVERRDVVTLAISVNPKDDTAELPMP